MNLKGYVKAAGAGETLPYANVLIKNTSHGTLSNVNGYFVLVNVPAGLCTLRVSYIGYEPVDLPVTLTDGKEPVIVSMKSQIWRGEAVTVTAEKNFQTIFFQRFRRSPGDKPDDLFFPGTGVAKGIEFLTPKKFSQLNGWASYALANDVAGEFEIVFVNDQRIKAANGNLEALPTLVDQTRLPGGPREQFKTLRSRPLREDRFIMQRADLTCFGEHGAKVYKVKREYANLHAFGQQDSRHRNEPETNIKNGLGVFAGFSSAAVRFCGQAKIMSAGVS